MPKFDCISEPYSQFGNISGQGIQKILGTPKHDRLQTLIRETVQNTWDARTKSKHALRYKVELCSLDTKQIKFLRSEVFESTTSNPAFGRLLKTQLKSNKIDVLMVSDFGTSGLDGPVRSDVATREGESTNFVDFVRNIGSPRDQELGGGTYGYGKSSVYNVSHSETILIYSACKNGRSIDHRFLVSGLSDPFEFKKTMYTGRHWWGKEEDEFLVPLDKQDSIVAAKAFGFENREKAGTGTTLGVLFPNLEDFPRDSVGQSIVSTLMWYFWPKMVDSEREIKFEVVVDGERIEIPDVRTTAPFSTFVKAYEQLNDKKLSTLIESQRPRQKLGRLAIATNPAMDRIEGLDNVEVSGKLHHVALMRPAELVVKYLEGPEIPSDMVEYAGVFRCDEEVERAFAQAEPPAHDDWISEYLADRRERTFVNVALRDVRNQLREFVDSKTIQPIATNNNLPLGGLSDRLGSILIGQSGQRLGTKLRGKKKTKKKKSKRSPGQKRLALEVEFESFKQVKKVNAAVFRISPVQNALKGKHKVIIDSRVQMDDGGTTRVPEGVEPPFVIEWRDDENKPIGSGPENFVDFSQSDYVTVVVSQPMHCAIVVDAKVEQ